MDTRETSLLSRAKGNLIRSGQQDIIETVGQGPADVPIVKRTGTLGPPPDYLNKTPTKMMRLDVTVNSGNSEAAHRALELST